MKKIISAVLLSLPMFAFAHPGHEAISVSEGVLAGVLHPLMGLDHLLAILALGVLLSKVSNKQAILIGSSFVALLALGFYGAQLGILNMAGNIIETLIMVSVALSLGFIVLPRVVKAHISALLITGFAVFHGIAHGLEVPVGASSQGFALGFLVSAIMLMVLSRLAIVALSAYQSKSGVQA
jgi:urease accessory protein